jgi:outer membrane protein assembly factor BamD (BamD/ComL family)
MYKRLFLCILAFLTCNSLLRAADNQTWEFRAGRWMEAPRPTTAPTVDEPMLDQAEQLLIQHDPKAAKKILVAWVKANKKSPVRDRCIFLLSDVFYQQDDRVKSFFYCDELMDEYPESKLFQAALKKQFDIATDYLNGYKESFLGMRILDMGTEGVQMMWRIQQRSPGSPLAEKGLHATADYYFNDAEFDLAEDAYNAYIQSYPHSDQIPRVKLRAAFSSLAQFRGVKFDASPIIDARAQLMVIQKEYPDLAAEENVQTVLDQIDSAFAKKLLDLGDFYQRTHVPRGAAYEYRFLIQTYPNFPEAQLAQAYLAALPPDESTEPPPPLARSYAPATEPSANAGGQ